MATKEEQVKTIFADKRRQLLDGVIAYAGALSAKLPPELSPFKTRLEAAVRELESLRPVEQYGDNDDFIWRLLADMESDFFPEPGDNHLTPVIDGLKAWDELLRIEAKGDYRGAFTLADIAGDIIAAAAGATCIQFVSQRLDVARFNEGQRNYLIRQAEIAGREAALNREKADLAKEFFASLNHQVPQA